MMRRALAVGDAASDEPMIGSVGRIVTDGVKVAVARW
jgi:hypothetical protein